MHNASCSKDKEQQLLTEEKKILVIQLLLGSGASIRQVSRLSSISFGIVRKYLTQRTVPCVTGIAMGRNMTFAIKAVKTAFGE